MYFWIFFNSSFTFVFEHCIIYFDKASSTSFIGISLKRINNETKQKKKKKKKK